MSSDAFATRHCPVPVEQQEKIRARIQADRQNRELQLQEMARKQQIGLSIAQQAAQLLKDQFQVSRVVLFGSLLDVEAMHDNSDIDLAVWGLPSDQLLRAWLVLDSSIDFQAAFSHIDLVRIEQTPEYMKVEIEKAHLEL